MSNQEYPITYRCEGARHGWCGFKHTDRRAAARCCQRHSAAETSRNTWIGDTNEDKQLSPVRYPITYVGEIPLGNLTDAEAGAHIADLEEIVREHIDNVERFSSGIEGIKFLN